MIEVEVPEHGIVEFPDGTPKEEMESAIYERWFRRSSLEPAFAGEELAPKEAEETPPVSIVPEQTERALKDYAEEKALTEAGKMRPGVIPPQPTQVEMGAGGIGPEIPMIGPQKTLPAKVGAGVVNFASGLVNFLKSNEGLMLGAAGSAKAPRALQQSAYNAILGQMVTEMPEATNELISKIKAGDTQGAVTAAANLIASPLIARSMLKHTYGAIPGTRGQVIEDLMRQLEKSKSPFASPDVDARMGFVAPLETQVRPEAIRPPMEVKPETALPIKQMIETVTPEATPAVENLPLTTREVAKEVTKPSDVSETSLVRDESIATETNESLVARTKVEDGSRDAAFAERAKAGNRVAASLKPGDVLVADDGLQIIVEEVNNDGTVFALNEKGKKIAEPINVHSWISQGGRVIRKKPVVSELTKEITPKAKEEYASQVTSPTIVPELEIRPSVGEEAPLRQPRPPAGAQTEAAPPLVEEKPPVRVEEAKHHIAVYGGKEILIDYVSDPKREFKVAAQRVRDNLKVGEKGYVISPDGKRYEISSETKTAKPVASPAKQPWEMTREEAVMKRPIPLEQGWKVSVRYLDNPAGPNRGTDVIWTEEKPVKGQSGFGAFGRYIVKTVSRERQSREQPEYQFRDKWAQEHRLSVEQALREGKPVPPEVLADYPDLKKSGKETSEVHAEEIQSGTKYQYRIIKRGDTYHAEMRIAHPDGTFSEWEGPIGVGAGKSRENVAFRFAERYSEVESFDPDITAAKKQIAERDAKLAQEKQVKQEEANRIYEIRSQYDKEVEAVKLPVGKKKTITVQTGEGPKEKPDTTVYGNLGITKTGNIRYGPKYEITHIPTGLSIGRDLMLKTMSEAKIIVKALIHTGVDLSKKEFTNEELAKLAQAKDTLKEGSKTPDYFLAKPGLKIKLGEPGEVGAITMPRTLRIFGEQTLGPNIKKGIDLAKATKDFIINTFSPATHAKAPDVDVMLKSLGTKEKMQVMAASALEQANNAMAKMPRSEQIAFIDRVKRGTPQPTPALRDIASLLRQWDDFLFNAIQLYKPTLSYLDNHLRVLWKVIPGRTTQRTFTGPSRRPWQGSKGWSKRHVLDDMSEGIALGGVPVSYNPIEMFLLHFQDGMKFVAANKAWEEYKNRGTVQFVKMGEQRPVGYVPVNDSIAQRYFPTEAGLVHAGQYFMEEGAARLLNNYLSSDYFRGTGGFAPIGKVLMAFKNATTALELSVSPFHAVFETFETISSSMGLGLAKIASGRILGGLKELAEYPLSPKMVSKEGWMGIQYAKSPSEFARVYPEAYHYFTTKYHAAADMINDLFNAGGKVGMTEEYRTQGLRNFKTALANDNYIAAVWHTLPAANRYLMKFLFETYIPRLKVGMFLKEYAFELDRRSSDLSAGRISRTQLAHQVWDFVEGRFGETNYDTLFWNRTFKSAMQFLFRSVTWKLGNLQSFGKAARDAVMELGVNWWKEKRAPRMTLPMAWVMGMAFNTALLGSLISKWSTGKYPWELSQDPDEIAKNMAFPRVDDKDPSRRISIPSYIRDAVHLAHTPVGYVKSSMSGMIGRTLDAWNNKDFYGTQVYNPDDPLFRKGLDIVEEIVPLPFTISNYLRAQRSGQTAAQTTAGMFGFTKAPSWISHTPAENRMIEIRAGMRSEAARTKEQADKSANLSKAIYAVKHGQMTAQEAAKQKLIDREDIKKVIQASKESYLLNGIRHSSMTVHDALKVYEVATPVERKQIKQAIRNKIANSKTLKAKERQEAYKQLRAMGD